VLRRVGQLSARSVGPRDAAIGLIVSDEFTRYVIILTRNPERERDDALIRAHVEFLRELDRKGQLVLAGPFQDGVGGMIIVRAESLATARAIAEADPFVAGGYESFELRTWLLSCEENNHMGMG
jgi:uncharacterized protein YciI